MRTPIAMLAVGAMLAVALGACDWTLTNRQDQRTPTDPGPAPSASPAPTAEPTTPVARVNVSEIGRENCAGNPEMSPFPCKVLVTCTPKDSAGNDVGLQYSPTWSVSGEGGITPTSSNAYNARIECDAAPRTIFAECSVGGVTGVQGFECVL